MLLLAAGCIEKKQELATVASNKAVMRTWCIGRLLIDLPTEFDPVAGGTSSFAPPDPTESGAKIDVVLQDLKIPQQAFLTHVETRRAHLMQEAGETTNILKDTQQLGSEAFMLRILRIDEAYVSELHLWIGGTYLVAETKSYRNQFEKAEARLRAFKDQLSVLDMHHNQRGFCIGPIVVGGKYGREMADFRFASKQRPDVFLSFDISTYGRDEKMPLLERMKGEDSLLNVFSMDHKVMRHGERDVAGMRAQEWLAWARVDDSGKRQHGFALETIRRIPSASQPRLHVELDSGERAGGDKEPLNSLSDAHAIALWDAVVGSIRPRP